jgi:hypothetical protein
MSTQSYVESPNLTDPSEVWALSHWLPQREQVITALQLRINEVVGVTGDEAENEADPRTTSMRQGIGLVTALGLLAGALPFFVNWINGIQAGTAAPLARLTQRAEAQSELWSALPLPMYIWQDTASTIAGLDPRLPGWLAALLSALGEWINWPLGWLACWLVYGLGILIVAKLFGARTTLPRFYAATAYAYTPLLLMALSPIPCLGPLMSLVGLVWAAVLYVHAVYVVTDLDFGRALLSVLLPAVGALLGGFILTGALLATLISGM